MGELSIKQLQCHHVGPLGLDVTTGHCVSLSGPSGAGKSLLLKAIIDLIPNTGQVSFSGQDRDLMRASQWRKLVGLLPAESFWWCERVGAHFPELNEEQGKWFELLGFDKQVLAWEVSRCSTGERQRLALLRLLCHGPKALLLDEPTANLDKTSSEKVEQIIAAYIKEQNCPAIWVSHDQSQVKRIASQHYTLGRDGQLQEISV